MKAIVIEQHGGPEVLIEREMPVPTPGPDELLLRVRAVSMNHLDIWVRKGIPGHKFPLPLIPGCDMAGEVVETGSLVKHLRAGDRLAVAPGVSCGRCEACLLGRDNLCREYGILGETRNGGCAEYACVPGRGAVPIPEGMSFESASAVGLVFLTAWQMVASKAQVRPGETVLVQAAGSGVSSAAIQIAKLRGATVYAVAGGREKCARARGLGADETIDHLSADVLEEVKRLTGKRGVDVVIDHVGAATWEGCLRCLARGGRLVTCGATSGHLATTDLRILFFKNISILGSTMGSMGELLEAWRHVAAGRLRPVVDRSFPLREVRAAHEYLESRKAFGKVVLIP